MDHFQPAVDPRKQELLEARFLGARVRDSRSSYSNIVFIHTSRRRFVVEGKRKRKKKANGL